MTKRKKIEASKNFTKGEDIKEEGADYKTFGISVKEKTTYDGYHINKIVVYGDEKMRNWILKRLDNDYEL